MKGGPVKPWSQSDDDAVDTAAAVADPSAPTAGPSVASSVKSGRAGVSRPGLPRRLRISSIWALAPLGIGVVWTLIAATSGSADAPGIGGLHAVGLVVCFLGAGGIVIAARQARRQAIDAVRWSITQRDRSDELTMGGAATNPEIAPLWKLLEQHTAHIQGRVSELARERERLSLELGLAEVQRRQVSAVVGTISDPILVIDAFDQLVMANRAAEELFGFKFDRALRQSVRDIVADESIVSAIAQAREADLRAARRRTEHAVGDWVYLMTTAPLSDDGSDEERRARHGVVAVFRDISREKQSARHKSEFVAHVAHELRTPLSSIRAYVEMLVDGEAADEKTRNEYYEIIQTATDRLSRLIDNMLNISRIEAGTVRINKKPVALSVVAREALDTLRPQAEAKGITLTEELTPVMYQVNVDHDLIHEAILNLLSNAIKYTPEKGKVHLRMSPQEATRRIRVEISDTGVGIPAEDLPKMFQKFFRVEANKNVAKGTGLGLNLVKQIVENVHGGELTLTSEVGKGSTFAIVLPLVS